MDDHRKLVEELFLQAADLPPEHRADYLDRHCADPDVRERVERLLHLDESGASAAVEEALVSSLQVRLTEPGAERVGNYTLVRRLGEGGMGTIYEATQESPERVVALKLIRRDLLGPETLRRFRYEVAVLGQLQHPGIAQIYDAGVLDSRDDGLPASGHHHEQPFFAMELVRGVPVTDYVVEKRLDMRARIELMIRICDAMQHAHQRSVIHRDLKPANILVTEEGQPKILDFGIARAADGSMDDVGFATATGQLVGTLPYMSPEQVGDEPGRVDTRSDVYALGVILFEVLTESLPHDLRDRSVPSAARVIQDAAPRRLSAHDSRFRGDVETIVAKALEKDRERRYGAASELAADLRRFLNGEPILARPATALYLLRKFTGRHRGLAFGLVATVLALLVGVAATGWQAYRATRAEREARDLMLSERAEKEAAILARRRESESRRRSDEISSFLLWGFGVGPGDEPPDGTVTIREMLDLVSARAPDYFAGRPESEAAAQGVIGNTYLMVGLPAQAIAPFTRACELLREMPDHEATLYTTLLWLNVAEREAGHGEAAANRWLFEAVAVARTILGERYPELDASVEEMMSSLLVATRPSEEEIEERLADVVQALGAAMPADHPDAAFPASLLAVVGSYLGNNFGASTAGFRMMEECLAIRRRLLPEDPGEWSYYDRHALLVYLWLVVMMPALEGEEDLRVARARELLELTEWFGAVSLWRADARGVLGDALLQRGRPVDREEGERLVLASHEELNRRHEAGNLHTLQALDRVVRMYSQPARPLELARTSLAALPRLSALDLAAYDPGDLHCAELMVDLGWFVVRHPELSAESYQIALAGIQRALQVAPEEPDCLITLGAALLRSGEPARALEVLEQADTLATDAGRGQHVLTWALLALAQHELGRNQEASQALAHLHGLPRVVANELSVDESDLLQEAQSALELR